MVIRTFENGSCNNDKMFEDISVNTENLAVQGIAIFFPKSEGFMYIHGKEIN